MLYKQEKGYWLSSPKLLKNMVAWDGIESLTHVFSVFIYCFNKLL